MTKKEVVKIDGLDIDDKEKQVRKHWAFALFGNIGFFLLLAFLVIVSGRDALISSALFVVSLSSMYILYRCAYKKHGTCLLTINLIFQPFYFIKIVFDILHTTDALSMSILLLDSALYIWLYVLSFQLRKINEKIQLQTVLASEEYVKAVASIGESKNVNDLDCKFHGAIRERSGLFVKALSCEYKAIKGHFVPPASKIGCSAHVALDNA